MRKTIRRSESNRSLQREVRTRNDQLERAARDLRNMRVENSDLRIQLRHANEALAPIRQAWDRPGPVPWWHRMMQQRVRRWMPILGNALDEAQGGQVDPRGTP